MNSEQEGETEDGERFSDTFSSLMASKAIGIKCLHEAGKNKDWPPMKSRILFRSRPMALFLTVSSSVLSACIFPLYFWSERRYTIVGISMHVDNSTVLCWGAACGSTQTTNVAPILGGSLEQSPGKRKRRV